jgi:hypothetical protein
MAAMEVYDLLVTKESAIRLAVDSALTVLRVDQVSWLLLMGGVCVCVLRVDQVSWLLLMGGGVWVAGMGGGGWKVGAAGGWVVAAALMFSLVWRLV